MKDKNERLISIQNINSLRRIVTVKNYNDVKEEIINYIWFKIGIKINIIIKRNHWRIIKL